MITTIKPKLDLHYAPGILVVLERNECTGRLAGWSSLPKHGPNCGCHGTRETFTTTGHAYWLKSDEVPWCLEQCRIPQVVNKGVDN